METLKDLKHVMIDTETLGLTPGCVVRTVSLVEFEPTTGKTGRKQTWVINLQDSIKAGFKIEAGSLKWWMMKSEEARKAFVATPEEETSLVSFVNEFVEWFKQYNGKVAVWGLQIDYDLPMVRCYLAYYYMYIMRKDDYPLPWNRKYLIDVRPFMEVYRAKHDEYKTAHTSMDKSSEKDKILAKLRKLMNLKENAAAIGNEGEAAAAAAGISRLLYMYNLTEADIPEQERIDNPIVSEDIPFKPEVQGGQWYELLVNCVCEFNLCTALVTSTYKKSRYTKDKFNIVGRQKNVEIVLYLISFLANKFYQIGKRDYPQYKHDCLFIKGIIPKTEYMYLRSYLYGCVLGLISKLRQEREEMQKECDVKSLVLSSRSEIDDFLKNKDIGKCKFRKPELDNESARKGFVTGQNVEINKGIYSKTVSKERRIEK